jgi:V/A-type H+-transporting ATPase subunit C
MWAASKHAYLSTRIAILRSRLMPEEEIDRLIEEPLSEGISRQLGVDLSDPAIDTAHIERSLMRSLLGDLAILLRPLHGASRSLFVFWARRFELFNLKALIRGKLRGLPDAEIERYLQDMPAFTVLQHDKLLRAENVAELLRQIEAGPYGDIARQARHVLEEKQDTMAVEAAIDQRYFAGLITRVHRLEKVDLDAMHKLLGNQADRLNLSWLLRYRFAYDLSPTETYYYLIHHGYRLSRERLLKLVELQEHSQVVAALPDGLREAIGEVSDPFEIERRLEHLVMRHAAGTLVRSPSVIARGFAYLMLRESELNRLRAIILGKRLELGTDLMHKAIGNGYLYEGAA